MKTQADLLSVSRASLYYQPRPPSAEEVQLKHRIDEIYTQLPYYGSRKIAAQLQREGMGINRKTVARYMQEMGISAIYPGPNLSQRNQKEGVYPYLLRHISSAYPNHIWGIDITYIRLQRGWMYLVAILDWYSRYVMSWELDQTLELPFVLTTVQRALEQAVPVICNSDQGFPLLEESNTTEAKVVKALPNLAVKTKGDSSMERKRSAGGTRSQEDAQARPYRVSPGLGKRQATRCR